MGRAIERDKHLAKLKQKLNHFRDRYGPQAQCLELLTYSFSSSMQIQGVFLYTIAISALSDIKKSMTEGRGIKKREKNAMNLIQLKLCRKISFGPSINDVTLMINEFICK